MKMIYTLVALATLMLAGAAPALADDGYRGLWDWNPNYRGAPLYVLGDRTNDMGLYLRRTNRTCGYHPDDSHDAFHRSLIDQGIRATWFIMDACAGDVLRVCSVEQRGNIKCAHFLPFYLTGDGWRRYDEVRNWR